MKRARKWSIRIGLALLVLVIVLAGAGTWFVRRPWPQVSGTLNLAGLQAPVDVIRDKWGVPQIYAQNDHDLFFAQGYIHAQDRLWQMEMNRRLASGTLSEVLGKTGLRLDQRWRIYGLRRVAEGAWSRLDSDSRTILETYAAGVNSFIETHRDRLPVEFTILGVNPAPWTPVDTLVWGNLMAYLYSPQGWQELEYAQLVAKVGQQAAEKIVLPNERGTPTIIGTASVAYDWLLHAQFKADLDAAHQWLGGTSASWGSNNWVVHGSRTTSGKPLLANDIHIDLAMPSFWYENGLHGGRFDNVGSTFPGVPLIVIGHNQRIAWGIAALRNDDQDFFIEKLNDTKNPTQYEFKGQWRDLEFAEETIVVKGSDPVKLRVPITHHGPIANMQDVANSPDQKPLAYSWTLYQSQSTFKALVGINLATNWNSFRAALREWDTPGLNVVYADVDGNIGYQATGKLAIRVPADDGRLPMPGWTGEYDWQGFIPFDKLPSLFNPPAGFVATANNKVISDDYPYLISAMWSPGYRATRINTLLNAKKKLTVQDMKDIQADTYLVPAAELLPYMLAVKPQTDLEAQALAQLKAWDMRHDVDSVGASIYEAVYMFMVKNTIGDELGDSPPPMEEEIFSRPSWINELPADDKWFDDVRTPQVENRADITSRSLSDAVKFLSQRLGSDPANWRWGRLHTVTLPHVPLGQSGIGLLERIFNSPTIPARGDFRTVNMGAYDWYTDQFQMIFGPGQRMIVDLADWDSMQSINSTGQSGQLFNPHREDQFVMWQNAEYRTVPSSSEAVQRTKESLLQLLP
jgi:penicillin G amidase